MAKSLAQERLWTDGMTAAYVMRLIWDDTSQQWRILLKPADGGQPHLFPDIEAAFLYVAGLYTDQA